MTAHWRQWTTAPTTRKGPSCQYAQVAMADVGARATKASPTSWSHPALRRVHAFSGAAAGGGCSYSGSRPSRIGCPFQLPFHPPT
eukprot:scaffold43903_cov28-Tisochrysis_lutea.AAC.2